ncbi:InlB B-repeat-containing protein [Parabacteroides acidifaciens]|uniref:InlB B-repeat-containing protein n=1 Tax=Parabacteroides acidifaciens TaxID=2290935 RepID=A0A3D8HK81_9BACT|nr:InlB B-repeat-containing protein [Parabacteroides acidifaciens]MBC8600379.1 InlB B-repeat-containing protein [Parabacteroides acidifaciens]RDU51007.1 hypothetical protein DWU89_01445 [Parabacteroides acidifaciens]
MKKEVTILSLRPHNRWLIYLFILAALLCSGVNKISAQDPTHGSEIYVFFKKANRGTLLYTDVNGHSPGGWIPVKLRAKSGTSKYGESLFLKTTDEPEKGNCILSLKKSYDDLNKITFLCAQFESKDDLNSFLDKKRPWKDLKKYKGAFISFHLVKESISTIDVDKYGQSDNKANYQSLAMASDLNGHYFVIEEMPYQSNALKVKSRFEYKTILKPDNGGELMYGVDNKTESNTVHITYINQAAYPIYVTAFQPVLTYFFSGKNQQSYQDQYNGYPVSSDEIWSIGGDFTLGSEPPYAGKSTSFRVLPNDSLSLDWPVNMFYPSFSETNRGLTLALQTPTANLTSSVSQVWEKLPASCSKTEEYTLPGAEDMLRFYGAFPEALPASGDQKIYLLLSNTEKFSKVELYNDEYEKIGTEITTLSTPGDLGYCFDLSTLLEDQPLGKYQLHCIGKNGETFKHNFTVEKNVETIDPDKIVTQLVVVQEDGKYLSVSRYEPPLHGSSKTLMKITGFMEKDKNSTDDKIIYNINENALINGVMQLKNDKVNSSTPSPLATLTWDQKAETVKFITLSNSNGTVITNLYAYGQKVFSSSSGEKNQIRIEMDSNINYRNTYADADDKRTPILIQGGVANQGVGIGDVTISDTGTPRLYLDGFSLNGKAKADCFLPSNILDAELNVEESLFGEYGFMGARGSLLNGTLGLHLFEQIGFKAQADVNFDMLPLSKNRYFNIDGSFNLYRLFEAKGGLECKPVDDRYNQQGHTSDLPFDLWLPTSFKVGYEGPIGVCDLKLLIDVKNLDNTSSRNYLTNPPTMELRGTLGLGKGPINVAGTGILNATHVGMTDASLDIFIPLLTDMEGMCSWGGTTYNKKTIPWFEVSGKGKLDVGGIGVLTGDAGARLRVDLAKSRKGKDYIMNKIENPGNVSLTEVSEILYDVMDVDYWGKIKLAIPIDLPFAGLEAEAGISGNKDYIRADASIKAYIDFAFLSGSIDAYAWIQYKYSTPQALTAGAGLRSGKDVEAGMPIYGYEYILPQPSRLRSTDTGNNRPITFTSNIIPVQKRKQSSFLRAFGDGYKASATEPLSVDENRIILRVRSKSNQTGLKVTTPMKDENDALYSQDFAANDLQWHQALDADGKALDYYEVSLPLNKSAEDNMNFAGDWKVEAMNADGTELDGNGKIEMQIFVAQETEKIHDVKLTNQTTVNLSADNIDSDSNYRLLYALVEDTVNQTNLQPIDTIQIQGSISDYTINPQSEAFKTVNGKYYVQVTLEKFVDQAKIEGSNETYDLYEPVSKAFSKEQYSYTNPNNPGEATAVTGKAAGSGIAQITWQSSSNEKTDGYIVTFTDEAGKSSTFTANKDASELRVRAGRPESNNDNNSSAVLETNKKYAVTVKPFHQLDSITNIFGKAGSVNDSLMIPDPEFFTLYALPTKFYLEKENKEQVPVITNGLLLDATPASIAGTVIYAQSSDKLILNCQSSINSGSANMEFRHSVDGVTYDKITPTSSGTEFTVEMTPLDKDTTYYAQALFYNNNSDTTLYEFRIKIDNVPPILMLTSLERDGTSKDNVRFILSGTTEAGADLFLNGHDITPQLTAKGFSLDVTDSLVLNFKAIDKAGNITIGKYLVSSDFTSGKDQTKSVKLLTPGGYTTFRLNKDGKADVKLLARIIDQKDEQTEITDPNAITWDINYDKHKMASLKKETDSTALASFSKGILPYGEGAGDVTLMVHYKKLLGDVAILHVRSYEEPVVPDAIISKAEDYLTLQFSEPEKPWEEQQKLRSDSPERTVQYSTDQTNWTNINSTAVSWPNEGGSVQVDLKKANLQSEQGIGYFRINFPDADGTSNILGVMLDELPDGAPQEVNVTFTIDGLPPFTQSTTCLTPVAEPAEPVRSGYTFDGWYTDASFTEIWDFKNIVPQDMTLYGKWTSDSPSGPSTPTGNEKVEQTSIRAVAMSNGILVSGLTLGKVLTVYSATGQRLYQAKVTTTEQLIPLLQDNMYILVHNEEHLKVLK